MEEAVLAVKSHMSRRRSIDIDSFYAGQLKHIKKMTHVFSYYTRQ